MTVLNVFTDKNGNYGNPLGIIVDIDRKLNEVERQKLTFKSGFSEVVFINNFEERNISIYSPLREIPFAGHAIIGAAYFLNKELNTSFKKIMTMGGVVDVWQEKELIWIRGVLANSPPWQFEMLETVEELEKLNISKSSNRRHTLVWAWIDKNKGLIRARTFAPDWGISEDEANGSGSMLLAAALKRSVVIYHGKGSVIHVRFYKKDYAEVGGSVKIVKK